MLPLLIAKSMGKAAAKKAQREAKSAAQNLKKQALRKVNNLKNQARNRATNYLDSQKKRIFQSAKGAVFTNTRGGNKNYNPTPAFRNVPGSPVVTPL
jgi:vacuolar-type H+-ATPase subunit E/Vma4